MTIEVNKNIELTGLLNKLSYGAQFDQPMSSAANKIVDAVVEKDRVINSPARYLEAIVVMLSRSDSLENDVVLLGRSDSEIRLFLGAVAEEIEKKYSHVRRSGGKVEHDGCWDIRVPSARSSNFLQGEILPKIDGHSAVWEYRESFVGLAPEQVIQHEFEAFYPKSIFDGKIKYTPVVEFARASSYRLMKGSSDEQLIHIAALLDDMARDRNHPIAMSIEDRTGTDWTEDSERWSLFQKLTDGISREISRGR